MFTYRAVHFIKNSFVGLYMMCYIHISERDYSPALLVRGLSGLEQHMRPVEHGGPTTENILDHLAYPSLP